jgi:UDP-N-acetylmuramoyl-tripeptide--D-alanyl-D-alanine ligase
VKGRDVSTVSFGFGETADVKAAHINVAYEGSDAVGMSFDLNINGEVAPVTVKGVVGQSYIYSLLAAAAVGKARGIQISAITTALSAYKAPKGRMNVIPGLNGSTIIDDTYNSSPDAAVAALDALKNIECKGSRIAVMGDMMELGKYSAEEHRNIGREAADVVNELVLVGPRSRMTASEAISNGLSAGKVHQFDTSAEAGTYVASIAKQGDLILFKGSQSTRMERAVKAVLREPEKAGTLLVRQELEWLNKA